MCVCVCVCMYVCMCVCVNVCVYVCMDACDDVEEGWERAVLSLADMDDDEKRIGSLGLCVCVYVRVYCVVICMYECVCVYVWV